MSGTFFDKLSVTLDFVSAPSPERRPNVMQRQRLPLYDDDKPSFKSRVGHRSPSPDSPMYRSTRPKHSPHRRRMQQLRELLSVKTLVTVARYLLPTLLVVLIFLWWNYETYVEVIVYRREWAEREVKKVEPLAGCFNPDRVSPEYNLTEAVYGPKYFNVAPGMPLRLGMDCYDFAGTLRMQPFHPKRTKHVNVHTYWRADLVPFGDRQEQTLKSFFATQDLETTKLILWSNGDLHARGIPHIDRWMKRYPNSFEAKVIDIEGWAKGTALEGSPMLKSIDDRAWVDGDLVRLLVTWVYGGVWLDMDTLLTRDLSPLLEHEFVTQWDCWDKIYRPLNGALMHFHKHSPYLCEAFHIMARSSTPRLGSTDWGSLLYLKMWRRLVAAGIPPFKILPFCFSDGRTCRPDNQLPQPFQKDPSSWGGGRSLKEGGELDEVLGKVFAVHLHNQWKFNFPVGGWIDRLLLRRFDDTLRRREVDEEQQRIEVNQEAIAEAERKQTKMKTQKRPAQGNAPGHPREEGHGNIEH